MERRGCEPSENEWLPVLEVLSHLSNILIAFNSSINILIYVFKVKFYWYLKGEFAKNERGFRLTSNRIRYPSLLILLLSVASMRRKLSKSLTPKSVESIQISVVAFSRLDRK